MIRPAGLLVGFTGTRSGLADTQSIALLAWLRAVSSPTLIAEFHHGACIGADTMAVRMVNCPPTRRLASRIVAHPPTNDSLVTTASLRLSDERRVPLPYLDRNKAIVDACEGGVLLACPEGPEVVRSGTWSTVRYARRVGRRVVIVWPSGEVTEDERSAGRQECSVHPARPDPDAS